MNPRAAVSIQVYGLNRLALVQERTRQLHDLEFLLLSLISLEEALVDLRARREGWQGKKDRARLDRKKAEYAEEIALLDRISSKINTFRIGIHEKMRAMTDERAPYAAQAQAWLKAYLESS